MSFPDAALSELSDRGPDRAPENGPGADAQGGGGMPETTTSVPVLLLDDDAQILREYVDMLESIGIQSHSATSAVRGLAMLEDHPEIGLVVADIRMPEMDGLRFASIVRQMKRTGPSPQFIFITGYGEISAALAALRLEASDFLLKPVRRSDFLSAVRRAVQRVEADRAISSIQSLLPIVARWQATAASTQRQALVGVPQLEEPGPIPPTPAPTGPADNSPERMAEMKSRVVQVIQSRQARDRHFPQHLFADPAWDMLLDLTLAKLSSKEISVSSVCLAAGVPQSTALRRLQDLERSGLVRRRRDRDDRRRIFVELTEDAMQRILRYLGVISMSPPREQKGA
ncbi:winged helix DNA-binding protein [Stella humosa]|uniref:Winged helix DNA-binding protein n=1 Tax=Stella humosa TaxID=94 RepID=A0A3N1MFT0_9PROT|nr:response regulator [Stella humosa]ROQ02005.1 winged helix DNA-binding protein [Stella humosa]